MNHALTATANRITLPPMLQKTAGGTLTPVNQEAYSRYNENVTFFMPVTNRHTKSPDLWALCGTEAEQSVEGRHLLGTSKGVDGCENPAQCPPYLILTGLLGSHNSTKKVLIMTDKPIKACTPEDCYTLDPRVDKTSYLNPLYLNMLRIQATLSLLQDSGNRPDGFECNHNTVMCTIDLSESLTRQCIAMADEMMGEGL